MAEEAEQHTGTEGGNKGGTALFLMRFPPRLKTDVIFYSFLSILSAHFSIAYLAGTKSYVDLVEYQKGLAKLPFQFRAMTSWLLHAMAQSRAFVNFAHRLPNPFQQPEVLGLAILNMVAVFAATVIVGRTIKIFVGDDVLVKTLSFLMPVSMYFSYVALANTYRLSFPYDVPNIPVFAVCLYAIFRRSSWLMQIAFCLACLSRETSVFLIIIYFLYEADRVRTAPVLIAGNIILMCAIWATTKFLLFSLYAKNPLEGGSQIGGLFTLRLEDNLTFFTHPEYWPNVLSAGGFLWIIVLACYRYIPSGSLRRTLWVVVPWTLSMSVVARVSESRIFGELSVLLTILAAVGISNFLTSRGYRAQSASDHMVLRGDNRCWE